MGTIAGIGISIAGSLILGFSDAQGEAGSRPLLGDGLALMGAIGGTGYFTIGRNLRGRLSTLAYVWLAYSSAAVFLLVGAALGGMTLVGYSPTVYLLILGLAIGPQLLGHTALNWGLRYLTATFVAITTLAEPVGSSFLALLLLSEPMTPPQFLGFTILLTGVFVAVVQEKRTVTKNIDKEKTAH